MQVQSNVYTMNGYRMGLMGLKGFDFDIARLSVAPFSVICPLVCWFERLRDRVAGCERLRFRHCWAIGTPFQCKMSTGMLVRTLIESV